MWVRSIPTLTFTRLTTQTRFCNRGLILGQQTPVDSAGVSVLPGCRLWVKKSWCFCWSVCQMKKCFRKTSSHCISTFTRKLRKVGGPRRLLVLTWNCGFRIMFLFQASSWRNWTTWHSQALSWAARTMQGCSSSLLPVSLWMASLSPPSLSCLVCSSRNWRCPGPKSFHSGSFCGSELNTAVRVEVYCCLCLCDVVVSLELNQNCKCWLNTNQIP